TLVRWQWLSSVAKVDLCLVKILEAHHDAIAILSELGHPGLIGDGIWAVWGAEAPTAIATLKSTKESATPTLVGAKAWASGADIATHALVTTRDGNVRGLAAVNIHDARVSYCADRWQAVGMARVSSGEVAFADVPVEVVGAPGDYLSRPGFWHGGAGIAACWYGGACAVANTLRIHPRVMKDPHAAAHLGAIDIQLCAARALLRELASRIDHDPQSGHALQVTRARSYIERVCTDVIDRVGRALGAGPLCLDGQHAQLCADLTTFIRQSHAEHDLESIGHQVHGEASAWSLNLLD
ncbi:MAG: acyl-CoA dehydrogenase, partial [Luteimonas sp.]